MAQSTGMNRDSTTVARVHTSLLTLDCPTWYRRGINGVWGQRSALPDLDLGHFSSSRPKSHRRTVPKTGREIRKGSDGRSRGWITPVLWLYSLPSGHTV